MFFSLGSKPLELWNKVVGVEGGEIRKVTDQDIQSPVYELLAPNTLIPKVYLACPADPSKTLGIKLREDLSRPFLLVSTQFRVVFQLISPRNCCSLPCAYH